MALSRHHQAISSPLNVEQIVNMAQDFDFSPARPLKSWFRAAQMLLTESAICEQDGDLQMAYLYLYRHATLVLGRIPQHPEAKDPKFKADISQAQKMVARNLSKLEQWKPRINRDHDQFVKAMERRHAEKQNLKHQGLGDEGRRGSVGSSQREWVRSEQATYEDSTRALSADEHRQLAVELAHKELRRRDVSRRSSRQAGIPPDTVAARRKGIVMEPAEAEDGGLTGLDPPGDGVREAGRHLYQEDRSSKDSPATSHRKTTSTFYRYPAVPSKESNIDWKMPALSTDLDAARQSLPPELPEKETLGNYREALPPRLPPKARDSYASTHSTETPSPPSLSQTPPSKYTFKPTSFTESGALLRPVFLPPELRKVFLNLAHPNTQRNLETCGILCGTIISNALFINHLIIPDQNSTSDTCDTTEEGDNALFDYCDTNELLVCGWIHTHPSQTCFLSSPDLHTSSGYQVMLPEAIAIVCAPRHSPDWGVFRLTDPPGLNHILNCQQRSLFHPHSETNLYTDAVKPGHVVEGPGLKFEVVDLRK